jgi:hypothetical protein
MRQMVWQYSTQSEARLVVEDIEMAHSHRFISIRNERVIEWLSVWIVRGGYSLDCCKR